MDLFTFFEYDSIYDSDAIEDEELRKFINDRLKELQRRYKQDIFDIDPNNGYIKFRQFVGLITLYNKKEKNYIHIQVLPKIYKGESDKQNKVENAINILLRMLEVYLGVDFFKSRDYGKINLNKQNMFEIYVMLFIEYLYKISLGIKRKYQTVESNVNSFKGRLLFAKHINKNLFNPTRFYTRHEEFTLDIPENRILKTAITKIYKTYKNVLSEDTKSKLKKYLFLFSDIPESQNIYADLSKSNIDKTFSYYKDAFKLARLLLTNYTLTNTKAENDAKRISEEEVGLIFDMNLLFEKYVARKLKEKCKGKSIKIQEQESKYHLISKESEGLFKIIPDIIVREGGNIYILDTKWKKIYQDQEKYNYNISQQDLYQMLSYASIYRALEGKQINIILIYPKTARFEEKLEFQFNDTNNTPITIFPFDLGNPCESLTSLCELFANNKGSKNY